MIQKVAGSVAPGQNAARMIQTNAPIRQLPEWQRALTEAFSKPLELLEFLGLPGNLARADSAFAMKVPRGYAARMEKGNARDPLFLQVWPAPAETEEVAGYADDAVGDLARLKAGGI